MQNVNLSVIVPCHNCEYTVESALKSIDYPAEIIAINDGSTDGTAKILREYIGKSGKNIKLISQSNMGVSAARNAGINACTGELIVFLDADDLFAKGYLKTVCEIMSGNDLDVMTCHRTRDLSNLELREDDPLVMTYAGRLLEKYTYSKKELGFTCFVYRRDIIQKHKIRFVPNVKYGEDIEFVTMYLAHCESAAELKSKCYYYRKNKSSATFTVNYSQTDVIGAAERASGYLDITKHPFARRFNEYMYHRAAFSVAHRFAKARNRKLYDRLNFEYPIRETMEFIANDKDSDLKSRIAAKAYLVSPELFYWGCFK